MSKPEPVQSTVTRRIFALGILFIISQTAAVADVYLSWVPRTERVSESPNQLDRIDFNREYNLYFNDLGIDLRSNSRQLKAQFRHMFNAPVNLISDTSEIAPQATADQIKATPLSLFTRLQQGFTLPELENPLVETYERWFVKNPAYLERVFQRASVYLPHIVNEVERRNLPMEIAILPVIESAFNPFAVSSAGAVGLWQFIPGTAKRYGVRMDFWYEGRRDLIDSTNAALDYLEFLSKEMNGDWFHAFASYNAGEHRLRKEINRNKRKRRPTHFNDLRLVKETKHYVPRLIALRNILRHPQRYKVELPNFEIDLPFKTVELNYPIDLGIAAELANISLRKLRSLNPGFKRRATAASGTSRLLLPPRNYKKFGQSVKERSAQSLLAVSGYRVRQGDTLSDIGHRHRLSVAAIKRANKIKGDRLNIGQALTLPISAQKFSVLGDDGAKVLLTSSRKNTKKKQKKSTKQRITHRVRRGDTLTAIAKRYRVYVRQLANWNAIRVSDVIRRGQRLVIYQ